MYDALKYKLAGAFGAIVCIVTLMGMFGIVKFDERNIPYAILSMLGFLLTLVAKLLDDRLYDKLDRELE